MVPAMSRLARPSGVFALVALDQRESLRAYLQEASGRPVDDEGVIAFKRDALADLLGDASGVLLDLDFGIPAMATLGPAPGERPGGLILAADNLVQDAGGAIVDTELDPRAGAGAVQHSGCTALKLLVIWRPGAGAAEKRSALVSRFMARCRELEVLGLVEALMDQPTREQARSPGGEGLYIEMAKEMAAHQPDIYKTEVPGPPSLPAGAIAERSAAISSTVPCPWVLLSNGVPPATYPDVVTAVCQGGASGFLAGRAIWRLAISDAGYNPGGGARARLQELVGIVERYGRPWWSASAAAS